MLTHKNNAYYLDSLRTTAVVSIFMMIGFTALNDMQQIVCTSEHAGAGTSRGCLRVIACVAVGLSWPSVHHRKSVLSAVVHQIGSEASWVGQGTVSCPKYMLPFFMPCITAGYPAWRYVVIWAGCDPNTEMLLLRSLLFPRYPTPITPTYMFGSAVVYRGRLEQVDSSAERSNTATPPVYPCKIWSARDTM